MDKAVRVMVTLTVGEKETRIKGDAKIFDPDHTPGELKELGLRNIGFWLDNWRYAQIGGHNHKSRVFCPWASVLMVETT